MTGFQVLLRISMRSNGEGLMRDEQAAGDVVEQTAGAEAVAADPSDLAPVELGALDELENVDFLLEEIENKIAPLALA